MPWVDSPADVTIGIRDLRVGRLAFPTVNDPVTEQLGSEVTNVGDATAVGQRRAKGFAFSWPIHGTPGDSDVYEAGLRMRRQLRSIMQNANLRLAGLYVTFDFDSERNGWVIIGEAELADANGGVPFAEFTLTVSQAFLVAQPHTHREARGMDVTDIRATGSPVDTLHERINLTGDFAGMASLPLAFLPRGAYDAAIQSRPLPTGTRSGTDGPIRVLAGVTDGDVVSFERAEADLNKGDVVIYDRRGNVTAFP